MNVDTIIVDLQGFKDIQNNFIVKEVAIVSQELTQTFLVKPPYSFHYLSDEEKKQVRWLERNRGIYWSEGYIDYREFLRVVVLYLENKKIMTKGLEKIQWIKELCTKCEVIDIGEKGCPNLPTLKKKFLKNKTDFNCVHHKINCALNNAICIKKWCFDNHTYMFDLFRK